MSPFWQRERETLNERLRREAVEIREDEAEEEEENEEREAEGGRPDGPYVHSYRGEGVFADHSGLIVRAPRNHDVIVVAETADQPGERVVFVALPDGTLLQEEGEDGNLIALANAVERELPAPYRARGTRDGDAWVIGADAIEVFELADDVDGDTAEVAVTDDGRTVTVDGTVAPAGARELEELGDSLYLTYYLRAARLDENLWEVEVTPL